MSGRLVDAWQHTWPEIWEPLSMNDSAGAEFFMDLFPLVFKALRPFRQPAAGESQVGYEAAKHLWDQRNAAAGTDSKAADALMRSWSPSDFLSDGSLARSFEAVFKFLFDPEARGLSAHFAVLTAQFLRSRNIRYRLVSPYELRPHVSGLFANLVAQVERGVAADEGLRELLQEFEHALNQASRSHAESDVKTCIAKAANLAEGIAGKHPDAGGGTFADHCNTFKKWPHNGLKNAFKNIYGFCSDYPGIRHAGNPKGKLRGLDTSDSIVAALVLVSSTGYFAANLDFAEIVG